MTPPDLRADVPHSARIYDYLLGGKDNFAADRQVAEKIRQSTPGLPISMRANRRFMARVVTQLAQSGIRQFLDVGTGLPTQPNLHQVAQGVAPDARVVYVDNDPLVLTHARALLTSAPQGRVEYIDADLRDPGAILASEQLKLFDLSRPVAVTAIAVLHNIVDDDQVKDILSTLMAPMSAGSALVLSVVTVDNDEAGGTRTISTYNESGVPVVSRTRAEVIALFGDLPVEEPGVVPVHHWHPGDEDRLVDDRDCYVYGGVAIKP